MLIKSKQTIKYTHCTIMFHSNSNGIRSLILVFFPSIGTILFSDLLLKYIYCLKLYMYSDNIYIL